MVSMRAGRSVMEICDIRANDLGKCALQIVDECLCGDLVLPEALGTDVVVVGGEHDASIVAGEDCIPAGLELLRVIIQWVAIDHGSELCLA